VKRQHFFPPPLWGGGEKATLFPSPLVGRR
jgi:hypothetical protein